MTTAPDYTSNETARYLAAMAFVVAAVLLGGLGLACMADATARNEHNWQRSHVGGP